MRHIFFSLFGLPILFLGCSILNLKGQSTITDSGKLKLIPYPNEISLSNGNFSLDHKTRISVLTSSEEDLFAASILIEEFKDVYNIDLPIGKAKSYPPNYIILTRPGINKNADERLKNAGLEINEGFHEEGYLLLSDRSGVIISAVSDAGIFYGIQTLKQLASRDNEGSSVIIKGCYIKDFPAMRYRWQQDDWNRGPIPTLEYAKEQIRIMSSYKINGYSIYAENIFESKKHPVINPYGGTITAEEMKELVEYGKKYHVEIIPQQQTFGHLHYVLRQERYAGLGEKHGSQILSPSEPGTYDFIKDYLSEVVPMFSSEFFHIGCDETFELGRGKSKELVESASHADVYLNHLKKVASMPELEGKKLLFWGEIAAEHPEKIKDLPNNLIAIAWDYIPRSYERFLKPYSENGIPTFVAPAAFYGGRVFPDYVSHLKNIRDFLNEGQEYGSIGMLNTSWDDMGEDLFDMGWYGVLFGAACSWQKGESSIEDFRNSFDWAFYRIDQGHPFADGIYLLSEVHTKVGAVNFEMAYVSPFSEAGAALQNHLQNLGLNQEMRLLCEEAYTLFHQNKDKAAIHQETIGALLFGARRMDFVFHKSILASQLSDLYDSFVRNDDEGYEVNTALYDMIMPYASRLGSLRDMTMELKMFHKDLWHCENRPFHWEIVSTKYDQMLFEWDRQYDRIQLNLQHQARTGEHLPRGEAGFIFERIPQ